MTSTVIITGASQGIGKATALLFAQKGYDVVLATRQPKRLELAAVEVRNLGQKALATDYGHQFLGLPLHYSSYTALLFATRHGDNCKCGVFWGQNAST